MDRSYFTSIYFREPGGVLFEIATMAPGFAIDEPLQELGRGLKLPPWEEANRAEIEAALPPVGTDDGAARRPARRLRAGAPLASADAVDDHGARTERRPEEHSRSRATGSIARGFACLAPAAAGGTWYPFSFMAPQRAERARAEFGARRSRIARGRVWPSGGVPSHAIVLLGFSQGACLASEFAVRHPRRYGGVMVFSGGLIGPPGTTWDDVTGSLDGTPVFLGCSDVDAHMPAAARDRERGRVPAAGRAGHANALSGHGAPRERRRDRRRAGGARRGDSVAVNTAAARESGDDEAVPGAIQPRNPGDAARVRAGRGGRAAAAARRTRCAAGVRRDDGRPFGGARLAAGAARRPARGRVRRARASTCRWTPWRGRWRGSARRAPTCASRSAAGRRSDSARRSPGRRGVPLVAVPTTYSGSEMTSIWGETDDAGKRTGRDPRVKPRVVIYDVTSPSGSPPP